MVLPQTKPKTGDKYRAPKTELDVTGYPVAPEGLGLEQVHVYMRHGERTPVSTRMTEFIPERWLMCSQARRFNATVGDTDNSTSALDITRVVERPDGRAVTGECFLGELTDVGRASTLAFGTALRRLYVERLGFLPDTLTDSTSVYFRSTNMPRTVESLQQAIHGLYPMSKCDANATHTLRVRNGREENLIGNTLGCKRLETLLINFANAAASAYNPTLEPLDKKVSKYLGDNPIRVDGRPRASGVLDTIRAAMAHDMKVPPEFEERAVSSVIERAVVNEWFSDKSEEVRRLGMGRLLGDIVEKMHLKTQSVNAAPKILVHSTHDTGLAALLNTLDVFDDRWPGFTASITFELYKANKKPSTTAPPVDTASAEAHVRARYSNRNLILPSCSEEGKHLPGSPEFCTLEAFTERVSELVPNDWEAECST
ncbi:phosphoglycerate mutase-like protein [Peniophora sp. CONT]|nr:phosphoglycerate mutase-like protein [Peniophora sp. CONT]